MKKANPPKKSQNPVRTHHEHRLFFTQVYLNFRLSKTGMAP
ncbi:hypothetical protein NC652_033934 [Populus alba x Populus x berolinensis]|nr:hypothetical protein NC652_033934 [Populus alba x Populus x berolinensis]